VRPHVTDGQNLKAHYHPWFDTGMSSTRRFL
jgi:hypothetical protein